MTDDELVVELALTRLDHPELELDEIAGLVIRRGGMDRAVELAARSLATRDELVGSAFDTAVEHVMRTVIRLRDGTDG